MNRWTCIFLCAALSIGGELLAQTCTVSGTVLDPSGAAVVGADVQLQAATPEANNHRPARLLCLPLRRQ